MFKAKNNGMDIDKPAKNRAKPQKRTSYIRAQESDSSSDSESSTIAFDENELKSNTNTMLLQREELRLEKNEAAEQPAPVEVDDKINESIKHLGQGVFFIPIPIRTISRSISSDSNATPLLESIRGASQPELLEHILSEENNSESEENPTASQSLSF